MILNHGGADWVMEARRKERKEGKEGRKNHKGVPEFKIVNRKMSMK